MVEGPAPVTEHKIGRDHRARTCPTRSEATQNLFRKLFGTIPGTTPQQSPEPAPEVSRTYSGTRSGTLLPHTPHTQSGRGENMWPAWRPSQDAPCKGIGSCFFPQFPDKFGPGATMRGEPCFEYFVSFLSTPTTLAACPLAACLAATRVRSCSCAVFVPRCCSLPPSHFASAPQDFDMTATSRTAHCSSHCCRPWPHRRRVQNIEQLAQVLWRHSWLPRWASECFVKAQRTCSVYVSGVLKAGRGRGLCPGQ